MPVTLLADINLRKTIVNGCRRREPALVFLLAQEMGLDEVPDPEVLAAAAQADCILVTHDKKSMPGHVADFLAAGNSSPGVFIIQQTCPVADAIEALLTVWTASEPMEWRDRVEYLPMK